MIWKSLKKREYYKVKQGERQTLWKMGFSSQPWIVPRSSNLDFCRMKTNFTVISERNMSPRASLLTQSSSLLPEHLDIWLCGTISIQIVTSEELQNLKVECSTNSVVDVIRPIFLACTANSLTNLTKSTIPRLFLETFIFTSSKVFCGEIEKKSYYYFKEKVT